MAVLTRNRAHHTPWKAIALLWLSGNGLRLTILAVPPVIATIRNDLHLTATEVGLLGSIPPAMFAVAALAGSLLVERLAWWRRWQAASRWSLQDLLCAPGAQTTPCCYYDRRHVGRCRDHATDHATTVRQWLPARIGLGTAVYTNAFWRRDSGRSAPRPPCPAAGRRQAGACRWWHGRLPIAIIAVVVYTLRRRRSDLAPRAGGAARPVLPDWHLGLVWRLGGLFCCINAIYFAANAFIPIYLAGKGRSDLIAGRCSH